MHGTYIKIRLNIIFPSMLRASTWSISFRFPIKSPFTVLLLLVSAKTLPSHSASLYARINKTLTLTTTDSLNSTSKSTACSKTSEIEPASLYGKYSLLIVIHVFVSMTYLHYLKSVSEIVICYDRLQAQKRRI
jgi:hypothetical protein